MTAPTAPTDREACLSLAQRQIGEADGWTPEQWDAQIGEDSLLLGEPPQQYFRPYRSALQYLLRPGQVKARTEGSVAEQYVDVAATAARLRELDVEWTAIRLPSGAEDAEQGAFSGEITWGGW